MSVPCMLPRHEDYPDRDEPPEELGEQWAESELCEHDHCIEIEGYRRSAPRNRLTRDEIESISADHELVWSEFHGGPVNG